jgi:single-strand DNA-binding protein
MQITGKIESIQTAQQVTDKFIKRTFVITTDGDRPQSIQLELQGKNVGIIDGCGVGREVTCDIDIRGRAWTNPQGETKYFNTITCWKMQLVGGGESQSVLTDEQPIPF